MNESTVTRDRSKALDDPQGFGKIFSKRPPVGVNRGKSDHMEEIFPRFWEKMKQFKIYWILFL
jgi:hypothetical protein